jgi:hypothetical protein
MIAETPFCWPIPVNIRAPPDGNGTIIPWSKLKFNPLGLYHLRRWQGVFPAKSGFFVANQARFSAADITWFAAGMHSNGQHAHAQDHFHTLHNSVFDQMSTSYTNPKKERKALGNQVLNLTFDMVHLFFHYQLSLIPIERLHFMIALPEEPPCSCTFLGCKYRALFLSLNISR